MCCIAAVAILLIFRGGDETGLSDLGTAADGSADVAVAPAETTTTAAPTTTTTTAPTTTTTTSTTTTTTTVPPRPTRVIVGDETVPITFSPYGWVIPEPSLGGLPLGADPSRLLPFVEPNDGPFGVLIDNAFLDEHEGAEWLGEEDGIPVIDRIDASDRCLNIMTTVILRRSFVSCPTRVQSDLWGYAGQIDDAPAVSVLGDDADGSIIEHNTITCSGFDADICSRTVRIGARNVIVQFNDLSHARGGVQLFDDATVVFNHLHDFSFGFDPSRADSVDDRVTHNNAVGNLGYPNTIVAGNFIDATYGRVSESPTEFVSPYFFDAYEGGVVELGDPINGFAFSNYLINDNGDGVRYERNYVESTGRPFRCNDSRRHDDSVCSAGISFNVFADLRIDDFGAEPPFRDFDGNGTLLGGCNFELAGEELVPLLLSDEDPDPQCTEQLELSTDAQAQFVEDLVSLTVDFG